MNKYRNKIYIQPFAGFIKPKPGESFSETNIKNINKLHFTYTKSFFKIFTQPISLMLKNIVDIFEQMKGSLDFVRTSLYKIRSYMLMYIADVMNRLSNLFSHMISTFANTRDIFAKIKGIYTIFIYLLWTVYNFLEWMVMTMYKLVRAVILVAISLLAGILWLVFWPFAPIVAYFALIGVAGEGFTICFDKNTLIKMRK